MVGRFNLEVLFPAGWKTVSPGKALLVGAEAKNIALDSPRAIANREEV